MKKLLLIIAAIFTLTSVHADLILHESFNREVGQLSKGDNTAMGTNTTDWWSFSGTSKYIQVEEGSLSYPGYVSEGKGNKVLYNGSGADDFRQFQQITSGKVYVAAIINVDSLKQSTAQDHFLSIGDASTSNMYARLYSSSVKPDDKFTGFKLGIAKNNENSANRGWSEEVYSPKTNYLVVLEYEFVNGEMNDTVRLYVNPTKTNKVPVAQCNQEGTTAGKGANGQADAAFLATVNLRQGTGTPQKLFVDEIKVATSWDDLFTEGGDTPIENKPEITAPTNLSFGGQVFTGVAATSTFTVKGKDLKGDITLAVDNNEITLSKTTIAKADAETEAGVEVTATLLPVKGGNQTASITVSSEDATAATIGAAWYTYATINCSTIAAINEEAAKVSEVAYVVYTGTAYVTYTSSETISGSTSNFVYIQDNTAAIKITNTYTSWDDVKQGDEVTQFALELTNPTANLLPITTLPLISVLSHNNSITPQVVTLATLKANPADYLNELVKVENVTLDQTSTTFGNTNDDNSIIPDYIAQDGVQASIKLTNNNELIGTIKPKKADIIGLSTSKAGNAICVRGKADIISKDAPTAIENITIDMLSGDYEIYTVSGQRIDALQSGVNIIRQGNNTYKVVR